MVDIYKNIEKYNLNKERKTLIIFNDIIADVLSSKQLQPIVSELFVKGRKLNIYLIFISQSYFAVPKNVRLNFTQYSIMKILSKQELQQIAFNHLSDIDFEDLMDLYKLCTAKPYSSLVNDTTLASDNPLGFRCNLFSKNIKTSHYNWW